jgi:hypothetical protein
MRNRPHLLLASSAALRLLSGCDKVIDMNYDTVPPELVIEATVEEGAGPHLARVSWTVRYDLVNEFPVVTDAAIMLTDLTEGVSAMMTHIGNGEYGLNSDITGVPGHTYRLDVSVGGKTYQAESVMPRPVVLDSVTVEVEVAAGESEATLTPHFKDPAGAGDRYRLRVEANGEIWPVIITYDDVLIDGQTSSIPFTSEEELFSGDSLEVELICVDRDVYRYFYALEVSQDQGPLGSVAPADPPSNLSNGALGFFSAQMRSSVSLVVP